MAAQTPLPQDDPSPSSSRIHGSPYEEPQDQAMDVDPTTTPTGGYNNGYNGYTHSNGNTTHLHRQISQSTDYPAPHQSSSPSTPEDSNGRYANPSLYPQQQQQAAYSPRPSSGLSGSSDRYAQYAQPQSQQENRSTAYQDQNSRSSQQQAAEQAARNKNSVVIKVGMVGDAQIGKTSLMVKYVEGSWDEDYIQTLGETPTSTYIIEKGRGYHPP